MKPAPELTNITRFEKLPYPNDAIILLKVMFLKKCIKLKRPKIKARAGVRAAAPPDKI